MLLQEAGHWELDFEVVWPHPFSCPDSPPSGCLVNATNYLSHTSAIVRSATHALSAIVNSSPSNHESGYIFPQVLIYHCD